MAWCRYMRTVKTTSGATAVQVVWSSRRGSREIEHLGSAHDEAEVEALKAAVQQQVAAGQLELDLDLANAGGGPLPITSSRMGTCWTPWSTLTGCRGWRTPGRVRPCSGTWCWPGSSSRSASSTACGSLTSASYATVKRRLRNLAGLKGYVTNLATCPDGTAVTCDSFTRDFAVDWTNNVPEQGAKAAKRHQAVSGYYHSLVTLARWRRITSYRDSGANRGMTALDAIRVALAGKPWLPPATPYSSLTPSSQSRRVAGGNHTPRPSQIRT